MGFSVSQVKEEDTQSEIETTSYRDKTNQTGINNSVTLGEKNSGDINQILQNEMSGESNI